MRHITRILGYRNYKYKSRYIPKTFGELLRKKKWIPNYSKLYLSKKSKK